MNSGMVTNGEDVMLNETKSLVKKLVIGERDREKARGGNKAQQPMNQSVFSLIGG